MSPTLSLAKGRINEFFEWFGDLSVFTWRVMRATVTPPFEFHELVRQLDEIGSKSLPLVAAAGAAIGVVLSLESPSKPGALRGQLAAPRRYRLFRY